MADVAVALTIHAAYQARLEQVLALPQHGVRLAPEEGCELIETSCDGVILAALVDPKTHRVRKAAYAGAMSNVQRGLLEVLCDTMIDRPVQECAEHAVIYVEYRLRDPSWPRPVQGVLSPDNADPAFQLPTRLVRDLAITYCRATGYAYGENFYDPPASPAWRKLSQEERHACVKAVFTEALEDLHLSPAEVTLMSVGNDNRVWVEFTGDFPGPVKGHLLMRLEATLKARVEQRLHVYTAERKDLNKIRRLAGTDVMPTNPGS